MADLDEVAADLRARHGRKMRVATKYVNLTRRFFAEHGIADYRIVESLGATEGAPGVGAAELIVDITTTGATLAANALKVLDDGVILRSEANLVASARAPWTDRAPAPRPAVLTRIAAEEEARTSREIRAALDPCEPRRPCARASPTIRRHPALSATGARRELVLHCPAARCSTSWRPCRRSAAPDITVRTFDYLFRPRNPLTSGWRSVG